MLNLLDLENRPYKNNKIIIHIDLNQFFVQCEFCKDPSLIGTICAVGTPGKRGIISTSSYEARKLGIKSGMASSFATSICPSLKIIEPNFKLYKEKSNQFFDYLRSRFGILEEASIDECYIDLSNIIDERTLEDFLLDLQLSIFKRTKLKCSIGCGWTKFLAKMGSDYKKPLGVTVFYENTYLDLISKLDLNDMYGLGKSHCEKLKTLGFNTIGDLLIGDRNLIIDIVGSNQYNYIIDALNGRTSTDVISSYGLPKSISSEKTFKDDISDFDEISNYISSCVEEIVKNLNDINMLCKTVTLKIRFNDFTTKTKQMSLDQYTNNYSLIFNTSIEIFQSFGIDHDLRLIGVSISNLIEN